MIVAAIKFDVRTLRLPYLARQLSDCLSGKSTRGYPAVEFRRRDLRSKSLMVTQDNDLDRFGPRCSQYPTSCLGWICIALRSG